MPDTYRDWASEFPEEYFSSFRITTEDTEFMQRATDAIFHPTMELLGDVYMTDTQDAGMDKEDVLLTLIAADIVRETLGTIIDLGITSMEEAVEDGEVGTDPDTRPDLYPDQLVGIRNIGHALLKGCIPQLTVMFGRVHVEAVDAGEQEQEIAAFATEAEAELAALFEEQGIVEG